jgi:hypothetical protein
VIFPSLKISNYLSLHLLSASVVHWMHSAGRPKMPNGCGPARGRSNRVVAALGEHLEGPTRSPEITASRLGNMRSGRLLEHRVRTPGRASSARVDMGGWVPAGVRRMLQGPVGMMLAARWSQCGQGCSGFKRKKSNCLYRFQQDILLREAALFSC